MNASSLLRATPARTAAVCLALALPATGCLPSGQDPVTRWAGCYDLSLGPWQPVMDLRGDSLYLALPPRIQLDTLPNSEGLGGMRLRPAPDAPPSVHHLTTWDAESRNSLRLAWGTGHTGVRMRVEARSGTLRGEAGSWWDSGRPGQTATVTGQRVACDAPLPPEHRTWRRFPRAVPLTNGTVLELDAALPKDVLIAGPGERQLFRAKDPPTGLFAGATHVSLALDRDSITYLEVVYPQDQHLQELVERLTLALGTPTGEWHPDHLGSRTVLWSGREGTLSASKRIRGPDCAEVSVTMHR